MPICPVSCRGPSGLGDANWPTTPAAQGPLFRGGGDGRGFSPMAQVAKGCGNCGAPDGRRISPTFVASPAVLADARAIPRLATAFRFVVAYFVLSMEIGLRGDGSRFYGFLDQ